MTSLFSLFCVEALIKNIFLRDTKLHLCFKLTQNALQLKMSVFWPCNHH